MNTDDQSSAHDVCKIDVVHNAMRPLDSRESGDSELDWCRSVHELQQPVTPAQSQQQVVDLHCESKERDTKLLPITSPNVNRFVETHLRCDGIFKYEHVANLPVSLSVKEFWKSVNIWGSYGQKFCVWFFWLIVYIRALIDQQSAQLGWHCTPSWPWWDRQMDRWTMA